jgi:hypothetical protein
VPGSGISFARRFWIVPKTIKHAADKTNDFFMTEDFIDFLKAAGEANKNASPTSPLNWYNQKKGQSSEKKPLHP